MKTNFGNLADLLAGNAPTITMLSGHLYSRNVIPFATHSTVQIYQNPPYERANQLLSGVMATVETHTSPNDIFSDLIICLKIVGFTDMPTRLEADLSKVTIRNYYVEICIL